MATTVHPPSDFAALPEVSPGVFTAPLRRPVQVGEDWLEPRQRSYSSAEDAIWNDLFERQMEILPGRACGAFMAGLQKLHLGTAGVPDFGQLSESLGRLTGWSVVPVPMLIPDHVFFWHLANRRFPAGNFIRTRETFDYIQEPDVFHDVFGHVPLHADPVFGDFLQRFGVLAANASTPEETLQMARLFWFTVEFGLVNEGGTKNTRSKTRIYGSGLISSHGDAANALGPNCERRPFELDAVISQPFEIDRLQDVLFVVDHFDQLFEAVETLSARRLA